MDTRQSTSLCSHALDEIGVGREGGNLDLSMDGWLNALCATLAKKEDLGCVYFGPV